MLLLCVVAAAAVVVVVVVVVCGTLHVMFFCAVVDAISLSNWNFCITRSRESANLEYLKNVTLEFMMSPSSSVKQQTITAIATILQFSPSEVENKKINPLLQTFINPLSQSYAKLNMLVSGQSNLADRTEDCVVGHNLVMRVWKPNFGSFCCAVSRLNSKAPFIRRKVSPGTRGTIPSPPPSPSQPGRGKFSYNCL